MDYTAVPRGNSFPYQTKYNYKSGHGSPHFFFAKIDRVQGPHAIQEDIKLGPHAKQEDIKLNGESVEANPVDLFVGYTLFLFFFFLNSNLWATPLNQSGSQLLCMGRISIHLQWMLETNCKIDHV